MAIAHSTLSVALVCAALLLIFRICRALAETGKPCYYCISHDGLRGWHSEMFFDQMAAIQAGTERHGIVVDNLTHVLYDPSRSPELRLVDDWPNASETFSDHIGDVQAVFE